MKFLVTLAICAVCVSGESLTRHKRGWGYETTTQSPGWSGWNSNPPPPPPPPPPTQKPGWGWNSPPAHPPPNHGWGSGWNQPTEPPGWGRPPPPSNGWGSGSYNNYPIYSNYPRPYRPRRLSDSGFYRSYPRNIRGSSLL